VTAPSTTPPAGLAAVKATIPHRHPIQLVDRVLEIVPDQRIVTVKAVSGNEPCYVSVPDGATEADHAYPAALLIESWCQSAALLSAWSRPADELADSVALFGGMSEVEVLAPVWPGDVVRHEVRVTRVVGETWIFEGAATVGDVPVLAVARVMTTLRPAWVLSGAPA